MMKQITPEMNLDIYRTLMKMSVVIVRLGGKSVKIMAEYEEACREFHRDIFMVEIKVNPDNAEETLLKWLRVDDQL
ncbi:hypothetical protein L5515_002041 [Caenorhabditis briggsae]|uniref:Uncharacterized protein n=1 Tax=Caenorhabditis briggsae TaxID=6238 RepID=A0AAE9E331_CAEBR|nr:hypothetical protein L5515_002041 [Caenorhabditis briggsae]